MVIIRRSMTATASVGHQTGWRPTDQRTMERGTEGSTHRGIGSTESRLATLRGQLDFNEVDHLASSNVDLFGQRSAPPSACTQGESSADHHIYASPGGPKVVDVNPEVDWDSSDEEEDTVTVRGAARHRCTTVPVYVVTSGNGSAN